MTSAPHEAAPVIFVPGAASRQVIDYHGRQRTILSRASRQRGEVATELAEFYPDSEIVVSCGYPGTDSTSREHPPAPGQREAHQIARPLLKLFHAEPVTELTGTTANGRLHIQGDSSDSMGDVIQAVHHGFLRPEDFAQYPDKMLIVVAGRQHFSRFRDMLSLALDVDPSRVRRAVAGTDYRGMPGQRFSSLLSPLRTYIEDIKLVFHRAALQIVQPKPGDIDALEQARQTFLEIAHPGQALRQSKILGRTALQTLLPKKSRSRLTPAA